MEKIKLIYCMGSGRSGTTLLNIILSNHPDIFACGELNNFHRIKEASFKCSCGKRVEDCNFWSKVYEKWIKDVGQDGYNKTIYDMKKYENFKSPTALLKLYFDYPLGKKNLNNYLNRSFKFYDAIRELSGKDVLVDISKNPIRAFLLSKHPRIDIKVIHLVRDGRGVAWSLNKDWNNRSIWRTAMYWSFINNLSNFIRKRLKHAKFFKYEDLVKFPEKTLLTIGTLCSMDFKPVVNYINQNLVQDETHIIAGNKLRKQKSIHLKLDTDWHTKLDQKKKETFFKIAGKMLKNYGYDKSK